MSKNVKLNSKEWINIVFEGRNKEYGAYKLRETSSRGHIAGALIVTLLTVLLAFLPTILEAVTPDKNLDDHLGNIDALVELTEIDDEEESIQDEILREEVAAPPPPLKTTIQFTPPAIVDDDEISDEDEMMTQEQLQETRVQISVATVDGVDDPDARDIADVLREERKQIVQEKEEIYMFVEEMPKFPGGEAELRSYIGQNLRYPTIAAENGIQGRVTIQFVVGTDGSVGDIKVLAGVDRSLNEEAVRVISTLPKWVPGRQNGVPVKVYFTVPVVFQLEQ